MIVKMLKYKQLLMIAIFSLATILGYAWFAQTKYFDVFLVWTQENLLLFMFLLWLVKLIGVIWPPIPGGLLTLAAIPIIGWKAAYLIDLAGSVVGSAGAYYLGRKYGMSFLEKLFDKNTVEKIKNFKIKKNREIEAVIILRILLGATIAEAVSYGAGLLKIRFDRFAIGLVVSHIMIGVPVYVFAEGVFNKNNFVVSVLGLILLVPILWKFRTRYFE